MKKLVLLPFMVFMVLTTCGKNDNPKKSKPVINSEVSVKMYRLVNGMNSNDSSNLVGTIKFKDTVNGLLVMPDLTSISPGLHGFHIHMNPSCDPASKLGQESSVLGLGAGGHYDPAETGAHSGLYVKSGHRGDLPVLYADNKGNANLVTLAPRLTTKDLYNRSVIIHSGGDNYSDLPKSLGGGGAREYCGVIVGY